MRDVKYYKEKLGLVRHPEGGYFKEVYRADEKINAEHLSARYYSSRNFSTSIYFLLEGRQFSSFHRLKSDELWHFYDGSSVKVYIIDAAGNLTLKVLGNDLDSGEELQIVIPRNTWFAAEVIDKSSFVLMGCTVAPGFEFDDFELGKREELIKQFPGHSEIIKTLTR